LEFKGTLFIIYIKKMEGMKAAEGAANQHNLRQEELCREERDLMRRERCIM